MFVKNFFPGKHKGFSVCTRRASKTLKILSKPYKYSGSRVHTMKFESKHPNLGRKVQKRIPYNLHTDIERLLTELGRLAVVQDPCDILSAICDNLSEKEIPSE